MAVTGTTVAAAATMLAALAAIFLSFVLCFYIVLCAKRSRSSGPPPPPGSGALAHLRFFFCGGDGRTGAGDGNAAVWYYDGGLDDASMASLPRREVAKGDEAIHCAVCITELAPGETARVLPRCGHGFHVGCVDMWLKSHSTCPLCRCPAVDAPPLPPAPVQAPEADEETPNFPTNVLFFGSQDDVSTGGGAAQPPAAVTTPAAPSPSAPLPESAGARGGLRRLLACGGASPPPSQQEDDAVRDIEMGHAGGDNSSSRSPKPAASS